MVLYRAKISDSKSIRGVIKDLKKSLKNVLLFKFGKIKIKNIGAKMRIDFWRDKKLKKNRIIEMFSKYGFVFLK